MKKGVNVFIRIEIETGVPLAVFAYTIIVCGLMVGEIPERVAKTPLESGTN
jgi:hypothetical protein